MKKGVATVAQLGEFDEIIDARSPSEYALDHLPGAINCPVLDDAQRARVGTLYKQQSAFDARRLGAAMVAENIARHLYERFQDKPRGWRPLVYCWRGGQRSGAFVTWLRMIGWDACQLEGGYKLWRREIVSRLDALPRQLKFRVVCGATGSAKTRVLEALSALGAQVLDLEALARHKGSVLGAIPGHSQPSQKSFETALHEALSGFDPTRPVYVEAESRKIGRIHLPEAVIAHIRASSCIAIEAGRDARLEFLARDYAYLGDDLETLCDQIDRLKGLQSNETVAHWKALARQHRLRELFGELIDGHYDPLYRRSQQRNFLRLDEADTVETDDLSPEGIRRLAVRILEHDDPALRVQDETRG